ncbi:pre-mRNA-splicing regulator WTAP [Nephila pilipes]|uniref:Pre-mRNA-splicing regulator WTAP n=1 Tax=Nephila pilipes TaxID=299642 RepID=A0A8X6N6R6_NEPPI|nr:pre-mRNA-splicing regulator WTAP [Nephila pilipes]
MAAKTPTITRVRVAREELEKMSKEQLQKCWNLQDQYIDLLENKLQSGSEHSELMSLRESEEKLKQQQLDASRRENILVMRLTTKEHEMQEFAEFIVSIVIKLYIWLSSNKDELDEFLLELDEDVEGMQSTIYYLQQQLREAKEQINQLQREKHEQSGTSNGLLEKHMPNNIDDYKLSKLQTIVENHEEDNISLDSLSNEVHRTEHASSPVIKKELNCEESMDVEPIKDCNDIKSEENKNIVNEPVLNVPAQKEASNELSNTPHETIVLENKNSISHEKLSPLVERTNLPVENLDSSENVQKRTNDQISDLNKSVEKDMEEMPPKDTPAQNTSQKPNKKTSDGAGRGRKRTRPRTPVETDGIKEDSLPVRKRARRRETEPRQDASEENRTSVEIDTDTEVQVAQTLASWASTKQQERTEVKQEVDDIALGNGELKTDSEEK